MPGTSACRSSCAALSVHTPDASIPHMPKREQLNPCLILLFPLLARAHLPPSTLQGCTPLFCSLQSRHLRCSRIHLVHPFIVYRGVRPSIQPTCHCDYKHFLSYMQHNSISYVTPLKILTTLKFPFKFFHRENIPVTQLIHPGAYTVKLRRVTA